MSVELTIAGTLQNLPKTTVKTIPLKFLHTDNTIQIRTQAGENVFGVTLSFSSYRENALKERIVADGRIIVPLLVWQVDKEKEAYTVLRGNTRLKIANDLVNDPTTSQGLIAELKELKCEVIRGITKEQALALVNDQDQTRYSKVDYVNWAWKLYSGGFNYLDIVRSDPGFYAEYIGTQSAKAKLLEYQQCKSPSEREKILGNWARGELDQNILLAHKLGSRVRKAFLLQAAKDSGLLKMPTQKADGTPDQPGDEQPEFNPKSKDGKVSRLSVLKKIKDNNPEKVKDDQFQELDEFKQTVQRYIDEDNKIVEKKVSNRPAEGKLIEYMNAAKSQAMKVAYKIATGEKDTSAEGIDAIAFKNERVMATLGDLHDKITNGDVAYTIASILKSANEEELKVHLSKFIKVD